jgi:hypothetical protein
MVARLAERVAHTDCGDHSPVDIVDAECLVLHPHMPHWGQTVARLQSPEGAIVGVTYTPVLH